MTSTDRFISLYHGGRKHSLDTILGYGLHQRTDFYCSRDHNLAEEAANAYGLDGSVLQMSMPETIFRVCLQRGYFEERPYLGCIQVEGTWEVIVRRGEGIKVINTVLYYPPFDNGLEAVLSRSLSHGKTL